MRVAFGVGGAGGPAGGLSIYARELVRALKETPDPPDLLLYRRKHVSPALGNGQTDGVREVSRLADRLNRQGLLRLEWVVGNFDLVHFSDPQTVPTGRPVVVTVHDLTPFLLPNMFPDIYTEAYNPAMALYRRAISVAVRRADLMMCDSETTRADLLRLFEVDTSKVRTVRLGVRRPPPGYTPRQLANPARLLILGRVEHRKNLTLAVSAVRLLREGGTEIELHVVGDLGNVEAPVVRAECERLAGGGKWLVWHGYREDSEVWELMAEAAMLLSPSHYEGFGFPPLEALVAGLRVVASDNPVHRELLAPLATLAPAGEAAAFAAAIGSALERPAPDAEAVDAHLARLGISWEACAATTLACYRAILP